MAPDLLGGFSIGPSNVRVVLAFEIFNGHPHVNNLGGGGVPGIGRTQVRWRCG